MKRLSYFTKTFLGAAWILAVMFVQVTSALGVGGTRVSILQVDDHQFPQMEVYVSVTTAQGNPVTGLTADNFEVLEDGQPVSAIQVQETTEATQPIAVVLAVDVSGSMKSSLPTAVQAIEGFIQNLQPEDWVSLVSFGDEAQVRQDWTQDKTLLQAQLNALVPEGDTALYDALVLALQQLQARGERKVLIVLTDGKDTQSTATADDVIQLAIQQGVPIYPVGFGDVDQKLLERFAEVTGGKAQIRPDVNTVAAAFATLSTLLRHQYVLQYVSALAADGKNHHLAIKVRYQGGESAATATFRATPQEVQIDLGDLKDGTVVRGVQTIQLAVTSPAPQITKVSLYLDDKLLTELTQAPFEYAWDTSKVKPGDHVLRIVAEDSAHNQGEVSLHVTVRPPIVVTWQNPAQDGAVLEGETDLRVQVDAASPVSEVIFRVDGEEIASLPGKADETVYSVLWDTTKAVAGEHTLSVLVKDAKGYEVEEKLSVQVALQGQGGILWLALLVLLAAAAILIPLTLRMRRQRKGYGAGGALASTASQGEAALVGAGVEPSSAVLVELTGLSPGKVWPLDAQEVRLGRSRKENDIILAGASASRRQALIRQVEGQVVLYNLSPHNPIRVNGEPVEQQRVLQPGDVLQAGESTFRFEVRR